MTREQAERRAEQLQAEHPERQFVARESDAGGWEVASVVIPERLRQGPLTPAIEARPRPSIADDPRTPHERRIPGLPGGL